VHHWTKQWSIGENGVHWTLFYTITGITSQSHGISNQHHVIYDGLFFLYQILIITRSMNRVILCWCIPFSQFLINIVEVRSHLASWVIVWRWTQLTQFLIRVFDVPIALVLRVAMWRWTHIFHILISMGDALIFLVLYYRVIRRGATSWVCISFYIHLSSEKYIMKFWQHFFFVGR
jgi:hypothetical protein